MLDPSFRRVLPWLVVPATVILLASLASAARSSKRMSDDERGQTLYARHCVQCHGAAGAGDGPAAQALVHPPADLRGKLSAGNRDEEAAVVLNGKGAMPGFEATFDRYDARRVLKYMEKQGRPGKAGDDKKQDVTPDTGKGNADQEAGQGQEGQ